LKSQSTAADQPEIGQNFTIRQLTAYCVEKLSICMKLMVAPSHLARGDLFDVPSSVQMMGFVG